MANGKPDDSLWANVITALMFFEMLAAYSALTAPTAEAKGRWTLIAWVACGAWLTAEALFRSLKRRRPRHEAADAGARAGGDRIAGRRRRPGRLHRGPARFHRGPARPDGEEAERGLQPDHQDQVEETDDHV